MAMQDIISEMLNEQIEVMADTGNAVKEGIYITVDPETRQMAVPEEYGILGVESDEKTERLWFKFPKVVGDNIDLTTLQLRVNYRNANSETDQYICTDVTEADDGENIIFSWQLSRKVTKYQGNVVFIVCAVKVESGSDATITNEWNTTLAQASVLEGLEVELSEDEEEQVSDIISQLLALMESTEGEIEAAKNTAISAVQSQQTTSVNAVKTAQNTATQAVQQAGSTAQASIASDKATALSDIEEAKQNALNSIPDDYTALSELAEETYERMELSKAPVIKQEATGENIQLTDAGDAPIGRLRICGRSQQEKTNGYQLFDASKLPSKTQGGVTVTNNGDGSFKVSGSGNLTGSFTLQYAATVEETQKLITKAGTCKLSGEFSQSMRPYFVFGLYMQTNGTSVPGKQITTVDGKSTFVITAEDVEKVRSGEYVIKSLFYDASGTAIGAGIIKPMVHIDGTGEWEPFTGGKPSPSPEYPQQIKSVGIDTANYFDKNGIDITRAIEYTVSGGFNPVVEEGNVALSNLVPVYPGQWVIFDGTNITYWSFLDKDGNQTWNGKDGDGGRNIPVQARPGDRYFVCNVDKRYLNTAIINYGKTLHPYKEYGVKQTEVNVESKSTNLIDYREVGRIGGNAEPYLIRDGFIVSGVWYAVIRNVKIKKNTQYSISFKHKEWAGNVNVGIYEHRPSGDYSSGLIFNNQSGHGVFNSGDNDVIDVLFYASAYATEGFVKYTDIMLNEGQEALPYQPYGQSHYTLNLTNQLRGIPVSSGGNYTDEKGQQYICDEIQIDQETKTGVYIQRVNEVVFDGSEDESWVAYTTGQGGGVSFVNINGTTDTKVGFQASKCDKFMNVNVAWDKSGYGIYSDHHTQTYKYFRQPNSDISDLAKWKEWLDENPVTLVYALATPIITNLTETQIEDLLSLYTYPTATDVHTEKEENSIQGGLEIQYGADTQKYIDQKIAEIAQQVLSLSTQK